MNIARSFRNLTRIEKVIWFTSEGLILLSALLFRESDFLTVIASLIGATALIFVGKGDVLGQLLTIIFAIVYAVISYKCRYYGEMITYMGMTAPTALWAMIVWIKNPYSEKEVKVGHMTPTKWLLLVLGTIIATIIMWKILGFFHTANLIVSTLSVSTSFLASMLTVLRSPYYAVCYAANDVVLIVLWVLATLADMGNLPMVLCFVVFLVNDIYGFANWKRMRERQNSHENLDKNDEKK